MKGGADAPRPTFSTPVTLAARSRQAGAARIGGPAAASPRCPAGSGCRRSRWPGRARAPATGIGWFVRSVFFIAAAAASAAPSWPDPPYRRAEAADVRVPGDRGGAAAARSSAAGGASRKPVPATIRPVPNRLFIVTRAGHRVAVAVERERTRPRPAASGSAAAGRAGREQRHAGRRRPRATVPRPPAPAPAPRRASPPASAAPRTRPPPPSPPSAGGGRKATCRGRPGASAARQVRGSAARIRRRVSRRRPPGATIARAAAPARPDRSRRRPAMRICASVASRAPAGSAARPRRAASRSGANTARAFGSGEQRPGDHGEIAEQRARRGHAEAGRLLGRRDQALERPVAVARACSANRPAGQHRHRGGPVGCRAAGAGARGGNRIASGTPALGPESRLGL